MLIAGTWRGTAGWSSRSESITRRWIKRRIVTKKRPKFSVHSAQNSAATREKRTRTFGNTNLGLLAQETYLAANRIMDEHGALTPASALAVAGSTSMLMFQMAPHIPAKFPPACKAGCSWCCYQGVAAWPLEVFVLAEWLRATRTEEDLRAVQDRLREAVAARDRQVAEGCRTTRVRCALLGADERCTAYRVRPSACLGWNMSDASQCEAWMNGDDEAGSLYNSSQVAIPQALWKGASVAVSDRGGPVAREVDLHSALLAVLEAGGEALQRWLSGGDQLAKAARILSASQTRGSDSEDPR